MGFTPPESGTMLLHLAASLGSVDIANLFLEQDGVNYTPRDAQGKACREVTHGRGVIKAIEDYHSFLNVPYRSLLRSYVLSPPTAHPSSPSSSLCAYASLTSPSSMTASGNAFLHEAACRKDLCLIELAVRAGTDVFVRNREGKMAGEGSAGKDEHVKVFSDGLRIMIRH